ncbi:MAG: hypothetical protein ACI9LV_000229 [Candidatus Nanohaloarchaea archaeon]|jgi:hypothetical protein
MDFRTGNLKEAVLKAFLASILSLPITSFAMDNYAALTVSVNPNNIVGTMTTGAMITTAFLVGISVFLSVYLKLEFDSSRKSLT